MELACFFAKNETNGSRSPLARQKPDRTPYWVLFVAIFLLYCAVSIRIEDDAWFATVCFGQFKANLPEYLNFLYHTWSTRLLLEALMMVFLRWELLFKLAIAG